MVPCTTVSASVELAPPLTEESGMSAAENPLVGSAEKNVPGLVLSSVREKGTGETTFTGSSASDPFCAIANTAVNPFTNCPGVGLLRSVGLMPLTATMRSEASALNIT